VAAGCRNGSDGCAGSEWRVLAASAVQAIRAVGSPEVLAVRLLWILLVLPGQPACGRAACHVPLSGRMPARTWLKACALNSEALLVLHMHGMQGPEGNPLPYSVPARCQSLYAATAKYPVLTCI
jgi:hypothetical protein